MTCWRPASSLVTLTSSNYCKLWFTPKICIRTRARPEKGRRALSRRMCRNRSLLFPSVKPENLHRQSPTARTRLRFPVGAFHCTTFARYSFLIIIVSVIAVITPTLISILQAEVEGCPIIILLVFNALLVATLGGVSLLRGGREAEDDGRCVHTCGKRLHLNDRQIYISRPRCLCGVVASALEHPPFTTPQFNGELLSIKENNVQYIKWKTCISKYFTVARWAGGYR